MRKVPVHYLRPNDKVWTPPAVLTFDTETCPVEGTEPEVLALRLWCATLIDRRPKYPAQTRLWTSQGWTGRELARWVDGATKAHPTLWAYAHNLGFDLTTTRLTTHLHRLGWEVTDFAVSGPAPWFRLRKASRHLTLTDSWSWLPGALEDIGVAINLEKPPLPADTDPEAAWLARCRGDTNILALAVCSLMDWWDDQGLGRWSITGAACGWNAFRHVPSPGKILVDPDPDGIRFDRLAVRGGRREAWRVGTFRNGPFVELDLLAAHPTVAATLPLPAGRERRFDHLAVDSSLLDNDRRGVIARALVATDTPRWPYRAHGSTWWPTGRFWTVLAGPELAEARRLGQLEQIGEGYVHRLGLSMAPWARWVLDVQHGLAPDTPPIARIAAKSWGRSVIGKWASRTHRSIRLGAAPIAEWGLERGWNHNAATRGAMVDLDGQRWWTTADQEPDNSYPAVLAWVESEVRVRLARVLDALGNVAVLQCDTDGLIVSVPMLTTVRLVGPGGRTAKAKNWLTIEKILARLAPLVAPLTLRAKRLHDEVAVIGPQHLEMADGHRLAGIRRDAVKVAPNTWQARAWPRLAWQMERGSPNGYSRPLLTSRLVGPYVTRWQLADGSLFPPQARVRGVLDTELVPWSELDPRPSPDLPAADQYGHLARLLDIGEWLCSHDASSAGKATPTPE